MFKNIFKLIVWVLIIAAAVLVYRAVLKYRDENKVLQQVVSRLQADSRIAEVLVTNVYYDEAQARSFTTIKFLEYDSGQNPLPAKYFTFSGNIIQFQSLVVRFDDLHIRRADSLRGRSAYLFWKVFMLAGANTQEFEITKANQIPNGYRIAKAVHPFEQKLWEKFWEYALKPQQAGEMGIKNAQIEAPGTMFVPGTLYRIKIEHDGGMRIDTEALPAILRGERIPE